MKPLRRIRGGHKEGGFTLIEMFMAALISGILMVVVARLFLGSFKGWLFNYSALIAQQKSRIYRDAINRNLREAEANTIDVSRYNTDQPTRSMLTFTDAGGKNWAFYQRDNSAVMSTWYLSGTARVLDKPNVVIPTKVERLIFYYPDVKNLRKLGFSLDLEWTLLTDKALHPITIQMVGQVDVRDP